MHSPTASSVDPVNTACAPHPVDQKQFSYQDIANHLQLSQMLKTPARLDGTPVVGLFWDYENIKLPADFAPKAAENINTRLKAMYTMEDGTL